MIAIKLTIAKFVIYIFEENYKIIKIKNKLIYKLP